MSEPQVATEQEVKETTEKLIQQSQENIKPDEAASMVFKYYWPQYKQLVSSLSNKDARRLKLTKSRTTKEKLRWNLQRIIKPKMKEKTMAGKLKREVVGSFYKSKDDSKPPYIKFRNAVTLKEGEIIRVENKKFQLQSLESAINAGKLNGEIAQKAKDRIEKIPEFVIAELVVLKAE